MSKRSSLLMVTLFLGCALVQTWGAEPAANAPKGRLATFDAAGGETYYALSLPPQAAPAKDEARDIVVLFDTSASQTGMYRTDALESLKTMLGQLGAKDRVMLMAVDVKPVALTDQFVAAQGPAIDEAVKKLEQRTPLGSTDLVGALQAAADCLEKNAKAPRAVVYVGDGISRAGSIQSESLNGIVKTLVDRRVPVNSLAIGPGRDALLLAILANRTGGALFVDTDETTAQQAGTAIAAAAGANVYWPTDAKLPAAMAEAFPKTIPPLRSDRDTIVVGVLKDRQPQTITSTLECGGAKVQGEWTVQPEASSPDFGFLPQLIELARPDGGAMLPTPGSFALREAARTIGKSADQLANLGTQALQAGDLESARTAGKEALARDPGNPQAAALQNLVARVESGKAPAAAAGAQGAPDLKLAPQAGHPAGDEETIEGPGGTFMDKVETESAVQAEIVQTDVEQRLNQARQRMAVSPDATQQELKDLLITIERVAGLKPEIRSQLRDRIQAAIRESQSRKIELENRQAQAQENQVAAIEAKRLADDTARERAKIKQLFERFNSLILEEKYELAEKEVVEQVRDIDLENPVATVGLWNARNMKNVLGMRRFRDLRHRNFADTMYEVEKSAMPFPDEPPIVYPDAQVWEQLTIGRKKYASVDLAGKPGSSEDRILQELDKQTNFEFLDTPLKDVIDEIKFRHEIPIVIDAKALSDLGVETSTPVTIDLKGISLRAALRLMLNELGLTYVIKDEVMQITTPEKAESNLITKVYPVGDLVIPVISGMGGGMGGMGGGMGGMGGGMGGMGGGMGGMGGGMGGFGGGMGGMGGGMGGMGGGMFAVDDDLTLGTAKPAEKAQAPVAKKAEAAPAEKANETPAEKTAERAPAEPIKLDRKDGETLEAAWERHFALHAQDTAMARVDHARQVRETVRQLNVQGQKLVDASQMDAAKAKFAEIVALIQAALRNGQPQSWMYEAMGLALQVSDAPPSEIERALMSAVDFSTNDEEVLYVARYLGQMGFDQTALKLYHTYADSNPYRPEPYVAGLTCAQRLKDEQGIRWACVGILSQAWPDRHRAIEDKARRVAESLLKKMAKENRTEEAKAFTAQLDEALTRDCMVKVTWTGSADVDISVEEPTAAVCSAQNSRTTAGGVMLGDNFAKAQSQSAGGYSEVYVCPKGFSGQYRLFLRRIWGKVSAGKVTVEICTNYGTPSQRYGKQQIPLGDKDAVVNFEVKDGRLKEPVAEQKLANVDAARQEMGREILAQQFAQVADPAVSGSYYNPGGMGNYGSGWDARSLASFLMGRPGAVGYRPQITLLPEGNQMMGMAVISADRRYVRFSLLGSMPVSSGVTDVSTFNFVTGSSGTSGNGGGSFGGGGTF